MFTNIGNKLFGWLAVLVLYPVVGWGQVIIEPPRSTTVCAGESAFFSTETNGGYAGWLFNNVILQRLPPETERQMHVSVTTTHNGTSIDKLIVPYNETFNGSKIQSAVGLFGSPDSSMTSTAAYLSYETNQQYAVSGLTATINDTVAKFRWNMPNSNAMTRYLFGVYDRGNNPVYSTGFLIINHTEYTYHFNQDNACHDLEFRVTGVEIQYPHCNDFKQTRYSAYYYMKPVMSSVIAEFDNKTVLVSWVSDSDSAYQVSIDDLDRGGLTQVAYVVDPPFDYTPQGCGQFNLNIAVSPAQCAEEPAFTHSASISFSIDCPTTGQNFGTQVSFLSLLLAVVAIIPLLKSQ